MSSELITQWVVKQLDDLLDVDDSIKTHSTQARASLTTQPTFAKMFQATIDYQNKVKELAPQIIQEWKDSNEYKQEKEAKKRRHERLAERRAVIQEEVDKVKSQVEDKIRKRLKLPENEELFIFDNQSCPSCRQGYCGDCGQCECMGDSD